MSAPGYKKVARGKKRARIKSLDYLIRQQRMLLDPIENSRVDLKLLQAGLLDLSTSRPLDSRPLDPFPPGGTYKGAAPAL